MSARTATCRCGQLSATCTGDPVRVSVCFCLNCQKRSGSSFAAQARWPDDRVQWEGETKSWSAAGDSGQVATFRFCPTCGSTVGYQAEGLPGLTAIAIGAFAEPSFPPPEYTVYGDRKHAWVDVAAPSLDPLD
ncbi:MULTISPECIES: GFA family protein [Sphingomonas]|uniref:GFA family protein n=1 Tax=Sphingomonas TaxID=13687 RepID=UPI000DEFC4B2|nr:MULTISPECIES: GFA family protein [Sphingomonas]